MGATPNNLHPIALRIPPPLLSSHHRQIFTPLLHPTETVLSPLNPNPHRYIFTQHLATNNNRSTGCVWRFSPRHHLTPTPLGAWRAAGIHTSYPLFSMRRPSSTKFCPQNNLMRRDDKCMALSIKYVAFTAPILLPITPSFFFSPISHSKQTIFVSSSSPSHPLSFSPQHKFPHHTIVIA